MPIESSCAIHGIQSKVDALSDIRGIRTLNPTGWKCAIPHCVRNWGPSGVGGFALWWDALAGYGIYIARANAG